MILIVLPMAVSAEIGWHEGDDIGWNGPNSQARVLSQTSVGELPETQPPSNPFLIAGGCVIRGVGQNAIAVQLMICLGANPVGGGIIMLTSKKTPCPCESEKR